MLRWTGGARARGNALRYGAMPQSRWEAPALRNGGGRPQSQVNPNSLAELDEVPQQRKGRKRQRPLYSHVDCAVPSQPQRTSSHHHRDHSNGSAATCSLDVIALHRIVACMGPRGHSPSSTRDVTKEASLPDLSPSFGYPEGVPAEEEDHALVQQGLALGDSDGDVPSRPSQALANTAAEAKYQPESDDDYEIVLPSSAFALHERAEPQQGPPLPLDFTFPTGETPFVLNSPSCHPSRKTACPKSAPRQPKDAFQRVVGSSSEFFDFAAAQSDSIDPWNPAAAPRANEIPFLHQDPPAASIPLPVSGGTVQSSRRLLLPKKPPCNLAFNIETESRSHSKKNAPPPNAPRPSYDESVVDSCTHTVLYDPRSFDTIADWG